MGIKHQLMHVHHQPDFKNLMDVVEEPAGGIAPMWPTVAQYQMFLTSLRKLDLGSYFSASENTKESSLLLPLQHGR